MNDNNLREGSLLRPETVGPTLRTPRPNRSAEVLQRDHRRSRFSTCISSPAIVPLDLSNARRARRCGRILRTDSGRASGRSTTTATTRAAFAPTAAKNGSVSRTTHRASTPKSRGSFHCARDSRAMRVPPPRPVRCCLRPRRTAEVSFSSAHYGRGRERRARLPVSGRATWRERPDAAAGRAAAFAAR